jgi:hypothetical protein
MVRDYWIFTRVFTNKRNIKSYGRGNKTTMIRKDMRLRFLTNEVNTILVTGHHQGDKKLGQGKDEERRKRVSSCMVMWAHEREFRRELRKIPCEMTLLTCHIFH